MEPNTKPHLRPMTTDEIHEMLARNNVGRIAYAKGSSIDIEPIHYVYSDGWLYGRTSRGTRLRRTGETWWPVAFEIDEVEGLLDWRSVVIHGGFYTLSPTGSQWEREAYDHAIEVLRTLIPETFTPEDPTPFRTVIFRIAVQEVTGRAAISRSADAEPVHAGAPE